MNINVIHHKDEMKNNLLTEEIKARLQDFPIYSQDGKKGEAEVLVKYYLPQTAWAWYVLEAKPMGDTWELYGITISPQIPAGEYGYFMLSELENICLDIPVKDAKTGEVIGTLPLCVDIDKYFNGKVKDIEAMQTGGI